MSGVDIVNIAAYKFVSIPDRQALQPVLLERCNELSLKGTILLADEGINLTVAGASTAIQLFLDFLCEGELFGGRFSDLDIKRSFSETQPFGKMVVRMPKEIITMRNPMIRPEAGRAPTVDPEQLKTWLEQGHDADGREIVLIDTRNSYEIDCGKFEGAIELPLENFSDFPELMRNALHEPGSDLANKTIVTYCTGGIRCEKAALFMKDELNLRVFQLDGGILNYFEKVGGSYWDGECFVFDDRYALDPELKPTSKVRPPGG
jgi:UPF0176 protein